MSHHPIGDMALLSDCHSAALVDRTGSVDWWCLPNFSSPSVFGRLLDERAGHFRVGVAGQLRSERHYLAGTLVLRTTMHGPHGSLEIDDALAMADGVRDHELGAGSPHAILRHARCTDGHVELEVEFAPRFEYGLTTPLMATTDQGVVARGGPTSLRLSSSVGLEVIQSTARARVTLTEGDTAAFAVHGVPTWEPIPPVWTPDEVHRRLDDTVEAWRSWSAAHQRYEGPFPDLVHLSGRVLQGLTYQPSGAIVAAPTTSLPESVGGGRNWDYRYAWVRDASLTLNALWIAACPDESVSFLNYLTIAASSIYGRRDMQIVFGIRGERDLTERILPWLSGWRDSSPVRVGNGAWTQAQRDVYGELLDAVHALRGSVGSIRAGERRFLRTIADRAAEGWHEPDQGIWEMRGPPRHFVHSKLMSWVALDRAIRLATDIEATPDMVERWSAIRDEIRTAIEEQGWSEKLGSFTQCFGSEELDASCLLMATVGFLPATDPRIQGTIEAIRRGLTDERGLVMRYRADDGLAGSEGAFLICTFWLAEAAAHCGRTDLARSAFERAAEHANDLGLLSEEVESTSGELIGNFPQALSHIGLINAAWALAGGARAASADAPTR